MPPHMGKLKKLRELDYYIVGEESHCSIKELGPLKRLRGHLLIEKLRNVSQVQESEEANLKGKEKLKGLELIWNDDKGGEVSSVHERDVLEQLQPHTNVEKLSISGYAGTKFPDWVGDSSFSNMVELKLEECKYCSSLPALGQLGSLKRLTIIGLEEITVVGPEFYGKSNKPPFACLESLAFRGMRQWKEWVPYSNMDEDNVATAAFPLLQQLVIFECPNLIKTLPADLPSLKGVDINHCDSLESFPLDLGPALEDVEILGRGKLKCLSAAAAELEHLKSLSIWISHCPNLKEIQSTHPPSLKTVRICGWDSLESFPLDLGPALEVIDIDSCRNLKCLSAAAAELEHLKYLKIKHCPNVKEIQPTHLPFLTTLVIRDCPNVKEVQPIHLPSLTTLVIRDCPNLKQIQLTHLPSLKSVKIENWDSLKSFALHLCPAIENIEILQCKNLKCLSAAVAELEHLKSLRIYNCPKLEAIQSTHLPSLTHLIIMGCDSLESFSLDWGLALKKIYIWKCGNLRCISAAAAAELEHLKSLVIEHCPNLKEIQPTLLPSLTLLRIWECDQLGSLPRAPSLRELAIWSHSPLEMVEQLMAVKLKDLYVRGCDSVTSLIIFPILSHLSLRPRCEELESFPPENMVLPPTLTSLCIEDFPNLKSFDNTALQSLTCLQRLTIIDCPKLLSLPEVWLPSSLTYLKITRLENLESLDHWGFHRLISLTELNISDCPKLQSIPKQGLPSSLTVHTYACPLL